MRIQHNIMAMSAYRNYTNNVSAMKKNLEKLSSGYKINRAGDDAAGLAISEKMRAQITGLETAQKNAKDGISLVQTAEGALTEVHDMLNRMVELATQSANGTYDNTTDRNQMQKEIEQLRSEINRIADSANFNGIQLLDGSMSTAASKVGSVSLVAGEAPEVTINDVSASKSPLTWASSATASATIGQIPSSSLTHLHSSSTPGAVGGFTIDLGGMKVQMASGTKTNVTVTISNGAKSATFTYAASTGELVSASKIAAEMAKYVLTATKGGTLAFVAATASVGKGAMVFKITAGSGSAGKNTVTFAPAAVAKATATASVFTGNTVASSKGTKITNANDLPDGWDLKHNYQVTASVAASSKVESQQGFQQVGVTNYTNTKTPGKSQFGQAVVALDASKITDGMIIKVGVGSTAKSYTIRTKGTVAANASDVIDLTKIVNATTAASANKADIAQAIANKFKQDDLGGIEIGVDKDNNLIVAEKVNADRTSAANAEVQKAMSSNGSFQKLVVFQTKETSNEVKGTATLEINTGKLRNGNTLTVTNNKGEAKTYTITTDKANQNKAGYVYVAASKMSTDLASAVKTALGDVTTTFGTGATATVEGKTVKISFKVGGDQELSDIKARATMTGNKPLVLQIGDTADKFNQLEVDIKDCHTDSLGIADISVADQDKAALAVNKIKDAINIVSDVRGTLGATQNRLDHTINNLSVMTENIQDAESTIRDTDVADEMMAYTKNNILIQSAQAMLAQANQVPQGVLQLLQ